MEYTSPGSSSCWWRNRTFVMTCLMAVILGHVIGVVHANSLRQHRKRRNHYGTDTFNSDHFFDYEDSTAMSQPEFLNTRSNVTVVEGNTATLPCAVRGLGTKRVAWRLLGARDDHFLTVGDFTWFLDNNIMVDYKVDRDHVTHWNLVIKSVKLSDQGTYQCQITDKVPIRTHVKLTVKKRPEREPAVTITGKEFVDRNEPIRLKCNATGGPRIPDEIDWFKDGTKIDPRSPKFKGVVMTKYRSLEHHAMISELIIEKTDESDTGNYICRSSDEKIISQKVTVLVAADTSNVKRGTASKQDGSSSEVKKPYEDASLGEAVQRVVETVTPGSSANSLIPVTLVSTLSVIATSLLL